MKTFQLVLVSLFAFAAVGTGQEASKRNVQSVEESILPAREPSLQVQRETGSPPRRRLCPGCFTALELEASKRNVRSVEESIMPGQEPSLQVQAQGETDSPARRRYCSRSGCYSALNTVPLQEDLGRFVVELPTWPPPEQSQQHPVQEDRDHIGMKLSAFQDLERRLQEWMFKARTKRSARGAAPARARGKQRSGTRAVCRGCYSGLMIVAPPAQGSTNETWIGSHSESEGDSSEEDTLPPKA